MSTALSPALRFIPIPTEVAQEARRTLRDRFGHSLAIQKVIAPCRICLRIPKAAEDLILLSYRPLPDRNPYAEVGPIFIHARPCAPYHSDIFPEDFSTRELVFRAYGKDGTIVDAVIAAPGQGERAAADLLDDANVEEVHVRHRSYTCFDFKIARG